MEAQSFETTELRSIAKLLNELQLKRLELVTFKDKITQYRILAESHEAIINNQKIIIENLEKKIELIDPAWYDDFGWGFAGGIFVCLVSGFLIAK